MLTRRQALALPLALPIPAQIRNRPRRKDTFFGIHFDLHPQEKDTDLGRDISAANIDDFLTRVRPDFVQYDCKGHAGWLGYPSQVSKSSPGIVNDSLAIWRKQSAARNIPLYIHFSGVWDSLAIAEHPEWARLDAAGKPDERQTSLWSAYAIERMIPQLLEAAAKYDLDGAWVDGECWQTNPDYSPAATRAWLQLGLGPEVPKKPGEPHWDVWLEFNRQRFRDYLKTYIAAVKAKFPNFEIASNWLYSTFVPEKPDLPVDFFSGDYLGNASITRARLDARYLHQSGQASGKSWDLMAWGFQQGNTNSIGHIHKPAAQLKQEASVVLAQGGAFQIYYQPSRAGRIDERHITVMAEVAEYCRERQALCHKSQSASQIAVLFSRNSLYKTSGKLFGGWGAPLNVCTGLLDALIDNYCSVDVAPDWSSLDYPILAIPEWLDIGDRLAQDLAARVQTGLKLFISGAQNCKRFAPHFAWRLDGEAAETVAWIATPSLFANARGLWQNVNPGQGTILAQRHLNFDSKLPGQPAAISWQIGQGQVVLAPGPIGQAYDATHAAALRDFVGLCLDALKTPRIQILGDERPPLEMVLRRQGSLTVLHLLNHANKQVAGNFATVDYIPPIPGQRLRVPLPVSPKRVMWEPKGRALGFEYKDGYAEFLTPEIPLHKMVTFA